MCKLTVFWLVSAYLFVQGFGIISGPLGSDPHGFLMKNLRDHALRHLPVRDEFFQRFRREQKRSWFENPSLEDFVALISVRSEGVTDSGQVTVTVSCLETAEFSWIISYNHGFALTKGTTRKDGIVMYTSVDIDLNEYEPRENPVFLMLWTNSFLVSISMNLTNMRQAGRESVNILGSILTAPDETTVNKKGKITFDVILPRSHTNVSDILSIQYSYTDTSTEELVLRPQVYESRKKAYGDTRIIITDVDSAVEACLVLSVANIETLSINGKPSFFTMGVTKLVNVPSSGLNNRSDMVHFMNNQAPEVVYPVTLSGNIRYGSVACAAYGHPKPTIEISRGERVLEHNEVRATCNKFTTIVYVALDGQSHSEAEGSYVCKATSGTETITKEITVA